MTNEEVREALVNTGVTCDDIKCLGFAVVGGLYWFCCENHSGMNSREYAVLSELHAPPFSFKVSPMATEPEEDEAMVYDLLDVGIVDLEDMRTFALDLMEKWDAIDKKEKAE